MASFFTLLFLSFLSLSLSLPNSTAPAPSHAISSPPRPPPTPLHSSSPRTPPSSPRRTPSSLPPSPPPRKPPTSPPPRPSPPSASEPQSPDEEPQMDNIADAMIGSGDFGNWIDLLMSSSANSSSPLPVSATIFVPDDVALPQPKNPDPYPNQVDFDPFLFAYHVVPRRLSFADLRACAIGSRLPTLLPGNSILITNNSFSNFTVNDSPITHPDLYLNGAVSVQGVADAFDYKRFGIGSGSDALKTHSAPPPPSHSSSPAPLPAVRPSPFRTRQTNPGYRFFPSQISAGADRSGSDFYWIPIVFGFCVMIQSLPIFIR